MVPTLHIDKIHTGLYNVRLEDRGQPITEDVNCSTIAEAIAHVGGDVPGDWATFVEIRYSGVCLGTIPTDRMVTESELLAAEVVALFAAVYQAEDVMTAEKGASTTAKLLSSTPISG